MLGWPPSQVHSGKCVVVLFGIPDAKHEIATWWSRLQPGKGNPNHSNQVSSISFMTSWALPPENQAILRDVKMGPLIFK